MAKKIPPIKTYQWAPPSLITRMDVRVQNDNNCVAYIRADPTHEDLVQLHALRDTFHRKGWTTSSDTRNDEPVLRLTGIKDQSELVSVLQNGQFAKGELTVTQAKEAPRQKLWDRVKTNSLQASGIFYTIGNALYVVSGIKRGKDWHQMRTGISFATGDILLATLGSKDDTKQFKSLLQKLKKHLEKQGIPIESDTAINAETAEKGGLGSRIYNYAHEHINKIKALAEVAGGYNYFFAGAKQGNRWKQATAVIFTLGFGSTLFIKEKKPDEEKLKNAGTWEKFKAFVHEKPLRIAGWSGLSNTLFTTIGAFQEKRKFPGSNFYKYDLATASSMLVGNSLYALSNKSTGGTITEEGLVRDIYGIAAQVINHVPVSKREDAIKSTVDFLGERIEIKGARSEIDALLRAQLVLSNDNPWFRANSGTPRVAAEETAAARQVKFAASLPGKNGNWQGFVTQPVTDPAITPVQSK
jgi:hypothetical protein